MQLPHPLSSYSQKPGSAPLVQKGGVPHHLWGKLSWMERSWDWVWVTNTGGAPHNMSPTTARVTAVLHTLDNMHFPTSHISQPTALFFSQLGGINDQDLGGPDLRCMSQIVCDAGFITQLLASCNPYYIPCLHWRRTRKRSATSKCGEGAPAHKEGAYWGIYMHPNLVVQEKSSIERGTFDWLVHETVFLTTYLRLLLTETHPVLERLRQRKLGGNIFVSYTALSALSAVYNLNIRKRNARHVACWRVFPFPRITFRARRKGKMWSLDNPWLFQKSIEEQWGTVSLT